MRKALSIAVGASRGSIKREAKSTSTRALKLISPRLIVTGTMSTKIRLTAGSRQSSAMRRRPSRPATQGKGSSVWMMVPTRIAPA